MANKFNNDALNLQLRITSEINELLKNRGINVSALKVDLKTTTKKKSSLSSDEKVVFLEGEIAISINSKLNKENVFKFSGDEEDETLDDDYISR